MLIFFEKSKMTVYKKNFIHFLEKVDWLNRNYYYKIRKIISRSSWSSLNHDSLIRLVWFRVISLNKLRSVKNVASASEPKVFTLKIVVVVSIGDILFYDSIHWENYYSLWKIFCSLITAFNINSSIQSESFNQLLWTSKKFEYY